MTGWIALFDILGRVYSCEIIVLPENERRIYQWEAGVKAEIKHMLKYFRMHLLYSSLMRHIWSPVSRSGLSRTRKTSTYWSESCKTSQRAFRIQVEAERAGTPQAGEGWAQRDRINVYQYLMGEERKMESRSCQQ